jgi:outer membrane lipoprotein SlyB
MTIPKIANVLTFAIAALTCVVLTGCVEAPPPRPEYHRVAPPPPPPQANTDVYAYPQQGQSPEQQDRDRYDCHLWAVKQTGFDPSAPGVPPHERVRVVSAGPPPSGAGTAVGAVAGAILGAAIAGPRNAGFGAVAGAITGGAIGNASDQAQAAANRQVIVEQDSRQSASMEQKAANYRRAITACLDARGYSVK